MTPRPLLAALMIAPVIGGCDGTTSSKRSADGGVLVEGGRQQSDVGTPATMRALDAQGDASGGGAWDGRFPDLPDGYPPAKCIPPCIWEALVACRVPELVRHPCIWEAASAPSSSPGLPQVTGTACSLESPVRLDVGTTVTPYGNRQTTNVTFTYSVNDTRCLTSEGFGFVSTTTSGTLARRFSDASGHTVAEDYPYGPLLPIPPRPPDLSEPVVFCGGRDDPRSSRYPYASGKNGDPARDHRTDPDCQPWLPYLGGEADFLPDPATTCVPGTCNPTPSIDPGDSGGASDSGSN